MSVVSKEILVYKNVPVTKYRWISYFALFHTGIMSLNLFFLATPKLLEERNDAIKNKYRPREMKPEEEANPELIPDKWELNPDYVPDTIVTKLKNAFRKEIFTFENFKNNLTERPYLAATMLGSTALIMGLFSFYSRRMIHRLILLPDDKVRIELFNAMPIGKPLAKEIALTDISCKAGRKSNHNYSLLQIRDTWGFFLVHKTEGEFVEPKLFDKYLGFERSWAVKPKKS